MEVDLKEKKLNIKIDVLKRFIQEETKVSAKKVYNAYSEVISQAGGDIEELRDTIYDVIVHDVGIDEEIAVEHLVDFETDVRKVVRKYIDSIAKTQLKQKEVV